ncbi:conserved protein of unknown function [Tenacibaculum soleae]|uniref:hypothetical protein n=1 Tax=Tenacibaculum soleae TaxID=447689 RepID=UPI003AB3CFA5
MITTEQILVENSTFKFYKLNFLSTINHKIAQEKENAFGISLILLMVSSMIASFSAALAITCISAMGANAVAISQRSLKTVVWSFFTAILINVLLIIYQIIF